MNEFNDVPDEPQLNQSPMLKLINSRNRKVSLVSSFIVVFFIVSFTIFLIYICWGAWIPQIWTRAFGTTNWEWPKPFLLTIWNGIWGVIVAAVLIIAPFLPVIFSLGLIDPIINAFTNESERQFEEKVKENQYKKQKYEDILENDKDGLIILVNYSRIELEQYYKIGLSQTSRSYKHSLIAMWIGFVIIVFGIVSSIYPEYFHLSNSKNDISIVSISSGIVTEIISALFLWIYKSSKAQLTYFYSRQIFVHNALLAYNIACTMTDSDKAKENIINKMLEYGLSASQLLKEESLPGAKKDPKV